MDQTRTSARGSGKSKREPAAKEEVAAKEPGTNGFSDLQFASGEPIKITGDTFSFHNNERYVVWSGHVRVNNATSQVTSNTVRLNFGKDLNDIQEILADGNVRISQGTRWATGDHAVLNQTKHTVTLTGSPVVHDGQDQIAGTKITVHLDTNQSDVENARAIIFPHQNKPSEDGSGGEHNDAHAGAATPERPSQPPPGIEGAAIEDR
jgi:lipopolysaccharide transport protein LptA